VKTTLELPDSLLRKVKSLAAARGETLKTFITEALLAHIATKSGTPRNVDEPVWMKHYGGLAHIRGEVKRMQREMDSVFGGIDQQEWK
jgi:hypothetical protein